MRGNVVPHAESYVQKCETVHVLDTHECEMVHVVGADPSESMSFECEYTYSDACLPSVAIPVGTQPDLSVPNSSISTQVNLDNVSSIGNQEIVPGLSPYVCRENNIPLCSNDVRLKPRHLIGGLPSQLNIHVWDYYLSYESDQCVRDYLYKGVRYGFDIVDGDVAIPTYHCTNYFSVCSGPAHDYVSDLILQEIAQGKYIRADFTPHCVHALGAVDKSDGSYRPITDCKRPLGESINNFMYTTCEEFSYSSVDLVADSMTEGCYMATTDISSAYRSVTVNPDHWLFQGVSWKFSDYDEYLLDTRLCFGLKCAPFVFTQLSNFVVSTMCRLGYNCVINYLDDFIVFGQTYEECQEAQSILITLLGQMGFHVSWKKCSSPSQVTQYLGILFDSINMRLVLPQQKIDKLYSELDFFQNRSRATKRQLQKLCGILSYCAKVIKGARTFSRRVIDLLKGLPDGNPRIRLTKDFHKDLSWWRQCASRFNGEAYVIVRNTGDGPIFHTDSSMSGYGIVHDYDWVGGFYNVSTCPLFTCDTCVDYHWLNITVPPDAHINYLELIPVYIGILLYSAMYPNTHILCYSDNTQVVSMINRGTSANPHAMTLLRHIFWICVEANIHLTARHIPGKSNVTADYISRVTDNIAMANFPAHLCCSGSGEAVRSGSFNSY